MLVLLCPSGPLFKPSRWQALALPPVVEACLLVAPQAAGHPPPNPLRPVVLQQPAQYLPDGRAQLRYRQRRRHLFSPDGSPGSGTTPPAATAPGGGASPPRSAPGSPPGPPPPWPASGSPRYGA